MNEYILKYGCNPNQGKARIFMENGKDLPIEILNGKAGYINLLDALNAYQLVKELHEATGMEAATSFKHVSPSGAAVGLPFSKELLKSYMCEDLEAELESSAIARAYARARGTDRMSSFGDFIALSSPCDEPCARLIAPEVSDGIIAPGYSEAALEILKAKRKGNYTIIKVDPYYEPEVVERKQVFGITFEQERNNQKITEACLSNIVTKNKKISDLAKIDILIAIITLKYTQSNSVCFVKNGQTIGVGAGQQSRIHCTRLAAEKANMWKLRQHERVLNLLFKDGIGRAEKSNAIEAYILGEENAEILEDGNWQAVFREKPKAITAEEKQEFLKKIKGVTLGSDAFFPFPDNIEEAAKNGAEFIAQTGGSVRDDLVIKAADAHGICMVFTGIRLFHH